MANNKVNHPKARLNLIIISLLGLLAFRAEPFQSLAADNNKDFTLTIIHTNDLHAHEEPFKENGKLVGGWAGVAHLIREFKQKHPDALVLDAGDIFQGSILYTKFHGSIEVDLLNKMGYDAYTIGNHEFDDGSTNLANQLSKAKFDIVCSNLDAAAVPKLAGLFKPYVIKTVNGQRIAIVGAITPELEALANHREGVKLKAKGDQWYEPIKKEVGELKSQGFDKIILLTHCGVSFEKELAEKIPDVDAVIGGHSHTRLEQPIVVTHDDGTTTTVVQTGAYGRAVGLLQLTFDEKGVVKPNLTHYKLSNVTESTPKEQELQAYIDKAMKPFEFMTKTVIGEATANFEKKNTSLSDCSMGNVVCDAIADSGSDYGVTIAFQNRGGIRGIIEKGPINLSEISQILPFDNFVTYATIDGNIIRRVLEHSLGDGLGGHFIDVHGLKFAYDKTRPSGKRVVFVLADDGKDNWKPLDDKASYKIAINDYTFEGGENYDFSGAKNAVKTKIRISDALSNYIKKQKQITPHSHDRIVCVRDGLLNITKKGADSILSLEDGPPQGRITIVAGTGLGVSTVFNAMPVPVADAEIVKTGLVANEDGDFEHSVAELLKSYKASAQKSGKAWLCAIAYPPRGSSENTVITGPVETSSQ